MAGNGFGHSVSLGNSIAVVGAPYTENEKGSAYIFKGANYSTREKKSIAGTLRFGWSVDIQDNTVLIGAPRTASGKGEAYIMTGADFSKVQVARDFISFSKNESDGDEFGFNVKLNLPWLSIGAPKDGGLDDIGSVHLFRND